MLFRSRHCNLVIMGMASSPSSTKRRLDRGSDLERHAIEQRLDSSSELESPSLSPTSIIYRRREPNDSREGDVGLDAQSASSRVGRSAVLRHELAGRRE